MSDSASNTSSPGASSTSSPVSAGRGRGRGRGYGIDNSPLRKPDSSRNSSRPGSSTQSPRGNSPSRSSQNIPKVTLSDSSVATSLKTSLNASAPEFVPTSTRTTKSLPALSVHAEEFVPTMQPASSDQYTELVSFLEFVLSELLNNPSSYDRSIERTTECLATMLTGSAAMEMACDIIFYWATAEPNFSYMCARLCEHLSIHIPNDHKGRFHQHMLKRCHNEHTLIKDLVHSNSTHASAFAVFLAELCSRQGFRIAPLMNALLEIIELMVQQLDDSLARAVGQVMKMCGATLEDDLAAINQTKRMDTLLSAITSKLSSSSGGAQLSRSMSELLKSILTLRAANWGRIMSPQSTVPSSPAASNFTNEPVFYSLTGEKISREQAGYGEEEAYEVDGSSQQWATNIVSDDVSGAAGDYSESEELVINGDLEELDLDVLVIEDEDEQMTEDMWAEYEKFEMERDKNLRMYDQDGPKQ